MNSLQSHVNWLALPVILLISFSEPAAAAGFLTAPTYPTGLDSGGVVAADFNRDGQQDLATANFEDGSVSVLLGNGDGTFAPHMDFPAGNGGPTFITVGDFNGDGSADVMVINLGAGGVNHNLTMLLGIGDGTFQPPSAPINAGFRPNFIATGDFNRDGNLDLAVANFAASGTVSVLLGNGDGTFQPLVAYAAGAYAYWVAIGDFDRDGKLDLAVADASSTGTVSVLLGNGDGSFQNPVSYAVGTNPVSVAVGDLNGDGNLDLAVANTQSDDVSILFGNGDGTFQPALSQSVGLSVSPQSILIADLNHDAKQDLVVVAGITDDLRVMLGNGDGSFQAPIGYMRNGVHLAVGDFDENGSLDFAQNSGIDAVAVLLGNGDGTLRSARDFFAGAGIFSVGVGDFNGDGKADVVTANLYDPKPEIALLSGKGDGTFRTAVTYGVRAGSFSLAVADFNLDGKPDVIVGGGNKVSVLLGKGDSTFQRPVTSLAETTENDFLVVGDFNGDGKPDVAALSFDSGEFAILLGNGDGRFQPPILYPSVAPFSAAAGDFNRDGKLDLAVSGQDGDTIWLGNGDGTFQMAGSYAGGYGSVVSGDFNRDGKLDLAVTDLSNLAVLLGNGDGTFQPPMDYAVPQSTYLVTMDMNGDGKLDLAAAAIQGINIAVLLGNGDGTFQTAINFAAAGPYGLAVGDFNGDQAPDLTFAESGVTLAVFLNTGGTRVSTTSSMNPSKLGQPVTFTAKVAATFAFVGTPTGTVTFKDGNKTLGKVTLNGGQASLTTSALGVGKHKISASYSGDVTFNRNHAQPLMQRVQ